MRDEQFFDFLIEGGVALALAFSPFRPLFRWAVDGPVEYRRNLVIHFTLVMNQAILGLALLAAKTESVERRFSKTSGGVH